MNECSFDFGKKRKKKKDKIGFVDVLDGIEEPFRVIISLRHGSYEHGFFYIIELLSFFERSLIDNTHEEQLG